MHLEILHKIMLISCIQSGIYRSKNFNCLVYFKKKDHRHTLTIGSVNWLNPVSVLSVAVWTQSDFLWGENTEWVWIQLDGWLFIQTVVLSHQPIPFHFYNSINTLIFINHINLFYLTLIPLLGFTLTQTIDWISKFNRMADYPTETWYGFILISACDNFCERTAAWWFICNYEISLALSL